MRPANHTVELMDHIELEGIIVDIDYTSIGDRSVIRMALKSGDKVYKLLDPSFYPYFYLSPFNKSLDTSTIAAMQIMHDGEKVPIHSATRMPMTIRGKEEQIIKIEANKRYHSY